MSPIGDIVPFSWWQTVISQYANSPILTQLLENLDSYIDPTFNITNFFDLIFNVDTAQGYGLDVWGRIVGVSRTVQIEIGNWFGFAQAAPNVSTFGQGAFYSGAPLTSNYDLADAPYKRMIFAKAASNITDGSIPAINKILMNMFPGRGNAYVTEGTKAQPYFGFAQARNTLGLSQGIFYSGQDLPTMVMTYTFNFVLTLVEQAIIAQSGVLPKPVGVKATIESF